MKQNYKLQIINYKLYFMGLAFCILIFLPLISEAAYKIYLKNGRVITEVDLVKEEAGKIKVYRGGIMIELPETSVIKIEEYNKIEPIKEESAKEAETPAEEELPEYLRYEERFSEDIPEPVVSKRPKENERDTEEETESTKKPRASERQLKRLEKLEEAGELPESTKPYKEFLDKLHEQKKLAP